MALNHMIRYHSIQAFHKVVALREGLGDGETADCAINHFPALVLRNPETLIRNFEDICSLLSPHGIAVKVVLEVVAMNGRLIASPAAVTVARLLAAARDSGREVRRLRAQSLLCLV